MSISKTEQNWERLFQELKSHLQATPIYPSKSENKTLFNWVKTHQNKKKNRALTNHQFEKLNSINFAWDIREYKWNNRFNDFQKYADNNVYPPSKGIDPDELVNWYRSQINYIKEGKLISI